MTAAQHENQLRRLLRSSYMYARPNCGMPDKMQPAEDWKRLFKQWGYEVKYD